MNPQLVPTTPDALAPTAEVNGTYVVKLGGRSVETPEGLARIAGDLATLLSRGARVVVVHGGGAQITRALEKSGLQARFVRGLRVTDTATLEVAEAVLTRVGKEVATALSRAGAPALALSGRDATLVVAAVKDPELGHVGSVTTVNANVLRFLSFNGLVPVIAPIALSASGEPLNVNADEVACAVAMALGAKGLVLMTDVDGVKDEMGSLIPELTTQGAHRLLATNAATGGMIPKLQSALDSVANGVKHVHIVNGNAPGILLAVASGQPVGTTVQEGL